MDVKYKDIEAKYGADVLAKVKTVVGSNDPWVILEKIDAALGLAEIGAARPQGGQQQPAGNGKSKLDILKEKVDKNERLTPEEEKSYFEELAKLW